MFLIWVLRSVKSKFSALCLNFLILLVANKLSGWPSNWISTYAIDQYWSCFLFVHWKCYWWSYKSRSKGTGNSHVSQTCKQNLISACFKLVILSNRLVCVVSYKRPDGDVKNFRKFFKFQVLKPLEVKTKFYNIEVILCFFSLIKVIVSKYNPMPL